MTTILPVDLGNGLVMRHATVADADALGKFQGENQERPEYPSKQLGVAAFTSDLLTSPPPSFAPGDFLIVEETATARIVSAMCLISQTWTYDGVPFRVGRPELVATAPDFRHRGLVRRQFELIHEWSAERGELVQAITGIPSFYRQYGYEMTVELGGGRAAYRTDLPEPKDNEAARYRIRPAGEADLSFLAETYRQAARRYLLAAVRGEEMWRHDLFGRSAASNVARSIRIIETIAGEPVGYLTLHPSLENRRDVVVRQFEVIPGVSWLEVTPIVLRYLRQIGKTLAEQSEQVDFERLYFGFSSEHPAMKVAEHLLTRDHPHYAWYLRVPDVPGFVRAIASVLEARLSTSVAVGYTGSLKISRYTDGFQLHFERGRLVDITSFRPAPEEFDFASFPGLTFLHLLFGYRTIEELRHIFADCLIERGEHRILLSILFPKKPSHVWPVE